MVRTGIKDEIKSRVNLQDALEALGIQPSPDHTRDMYCCPWCGSGTHRGDRSSGALHNMGDRVHCQVCGNGGDVFDLVAQKRHMDPHDLVAVMAETCDLMGLYDLRAELGEPESNGVALKWDSVAKVQDAPKTSETRPQDSTAASEKQPDYTAGRAEAERYVADCQKNLHMAEHYLASRGITVPEAQSLGWGYDTGTKRVIIPWPGSPWYYAGRAVDDSVVPKYRNVSGEQVGPRPLWDPDATKEPVFFIVEGLVDACVLRLLGHPAVALASNRMSEKNLAEFAEEIRSQKDAGIAVVMLDNDNAGADGAADLEKELTEKGVMWTEAPVAELGCKDAGELFKANKVKLAELITAWRKEALQHAEDLKAQAWREQMRRNHIVDPAVAVRELYELKEARAPISTGFETLDRMLGGGLHAKSLHIIGAQSSEGKTTLTLQIADHVAKSGHPVLFVTIEQRPNELIAKSLSRIIWQASGVVLPALDILNPLKRTEWGNEELATLACARDAYAEEIAPCMLFMDPDARPDVAKIATWANIMAERYGEPPVVFVDYLQLLLPESERDSDKTTTDKNVTALRRMAGKLNTPVWVVASLNRQSYTAPMATDSFKESGAIEYGSDILIALEPFDLETRWHNATDKTKPMVALGLHDKTRRAVKRWIDLRILKNRFGSLTDEPLAFVYQANTDAFSFVSRVSRTKRHEDNTELSDPTYRARAGIPTL